MSLRTALSLACLPVAFALLAGCAGSRSTGLPSAGSAAAPAGTLAQVQAPRKGRLRITIRVPRKRKHRHPAYVGPATASLAITISRAGKTVVAKKLNLTPSASCQPTLGGTVCSFTVALAAGTGYSASVTTYDGANGTGNVLSLAQGVSFTIAGGKDNEIPLTLNAVPAKLISLSASSDSFYVEALDADGNIIVGPGAPSYTASKASGSTLATITQPTTRSPNLVTLAAVSPAPLADESETIAVTASYPVGTDGCTQGGASCTLSDAATATATANAIAFVNMYYSEATVWGYTTPLSSSNQTAAYKVTEGSDVYSIATDSSGNLFVGGSSELYEYPAPYSSAVATNSNGVDDPYGLSFDASGNLFCSQQRQRHRDQLCRAVHRLRGAEHLERSGRPVRGRSRLEQKRLRRQQHQWDPDRLRLRVDDRGLHGHAHFEALYAARLRKHALRR
ncbi:MAG TPA: hypothetical protein VMH02_08835 [Verrucomicrobiae bacterium]|nr:hypothetical protein [Verrucomicrobiae bacterium]